MWFRPSNMLKAIVAFCVALQSADALTIDEREALNVEIAAMDFMDPTVSVLEMKDKLMMRMPVPETVMNDQVRAYKAKDENIYRTLKDGRYEQMIFRNMELREREIRKLKEFQEWLASKNLSMPKGFEDGVELVRVLSNRQFKFQEVYDAIHKFDKDHRERLLPILRDYEKYLPLLETGFFYAYGRDKAMRPIIYFDVRKYVDSGASIDEMLTVQDIVQTYVVHHAMVPGQIENYHTIVDASNVGYTEIPYTSLARITNHMRDGYFATCFTLQIVNVPRLIKMAANFIYNFLGEFQKESVLFFNTDFKPSFKKVMGMKNVLKKFGGDVPPIQQGFFPPQLNISEETKPKQAAAKPDQQTKVCVEEL